MNGYIGAGNTPSGPGGDQSQTDQTSCECLTQWTTKMSSQKWECYIFFVVIIYFVCLVAIKELTRGSMEERSSSEMKQQISRMKSEVAREMETLRNQLMTFRANAIHPSPAFMSSHVPSRDGRDMYEIFKTFMPAF